MTTTTVTPLNAKAWLASGEAVLIDVREPDEFRAEHIPYAASLPLSTVGDRLADVALPANRKILFHCQRGARGEKACVAVQAAGAAREVYNIEGGIEGWKAAGLPVVSQAAGSGVSIFRQVQIVVGALVLLGVVAGFSGIPSGFIAAGVLGAALLMAGLTGWCGLALLLAKMPWNKA